MFGIHFKKVRFLENNVSRECFLINFPRKLSRGGGGGWESIHDSQA